MAALLFLVLQMLPSLFRVNKVSNRDTFSVDFVLVVGLLSFLCPPSVLRGLPLSC